MKLVKSVATRFVGMVIYTSKHIRKFCLRKIFVVNYFSNPLRRNWKGRSEQNSGSSTNIDDRIYVVRVDMFLLVGVGTYKRSFHFEKTLLVKLVYATF